METARLFTSGGSQAVRLPKSCRFDCNEVAVKKVGSIVMLYSKDDALKNLLNGEPFTDDVFESILNARLEDAAHAKAMKLVLVTNNTKEFGRVEGLVLEDWMICEQ